MSAKLVDRLVSAVVGAASAVGTVWFLSNAEKNADAPDAPPTKIARLEVDSLRIGESLVLVDPTTKEPTLELRDGALYAQNGVFSEQIGAYRVLGQQLQATPDDPFDARARVFSEIATNEEGGAYLALLSPRESHSVTIGFDKNEKGCVVSQNNDDSSMVAQAIFLKPSADDAAKPEPIPSPDAIQNVEAPTAGALAPAQTGVVPAVSTTPNVRPGIVPASSAAPNAPAQTQPQPGVAPANVRPGVIPASSTVPTAPAQPQSGVVSAVSEEAPGTVRSGIAPVSSVELASETGSGVERAAFFAPKPSESDERRASATVGAPTAAPALTLASGDARL